VPNLLRNPRGAQVLLLLSSPVFWFCLILVPIITLTFDVAAKAARTTIKTSETDRIRQQWRIFFQYPPPLGLEFLPNS
jgi:hypothetical protein